MQVSAFQMTPRSGPRPPQPPALWDPTKQRVSGSPARVTRAPGSGIGSVASGDDGVTFTFRAGSPPALVEGAAGQRPRADHRDNGAARHALPRLGRGGARKVFEPCAPGTPALLRRAL
ncbi:hypothetical protein GCM10009751_14320 [Myceligenerans crystallogenes]|uniref:Uncharacterized protein n=1 Tax=Myceligenerans crystallogenes TaxID=316335 RepID=A0ABP4ZJE9_9MICO